MINLRVLVPEASRNYVQNPAFRYTTTGWNVQGATLTRSLDYARFGIASGKVVTAGLAQREGIYYRVSTLSGISEPITVSVYLRGAGKVRLRLDNNVVGGSEYLSQAIELTDRWERYSVTGFSTGGNDMRLWVESDDTVARAYTFYIDGSQMERKPYATSYMDGDQPGCRWNIVAHASDSIRTADTRKGGRWVDLAGPCRPDNDIYITLMGGFGSAPVANNTQPWAQASGSYYQNQKILDRVVSMNFTVKNQNLRSAPPASLQALHSLRQQLVDLFKSDVTIGDEPFLFEYSETDSERPIYISLRYEAGLEGNWDIRNGYFNSFIIRLLAVDPLLVEDNQDVKQLGVKNTFSGNTTKPFWGRINGEWNKLIEMASLGFVYKVAEAPNGLIYFTTSESSIPRLYSWDGATATVIGTATRASGTPFLIPIAFGPGGLVYVGGRFDAINGVSANNIAVYNPATGLFSALGTGVSTNVHAICVANNGQVYVGGGFTSAGGVTANAIARWDGLAWRTVGATSGFVANENVFSIVKGRDKDTLYVGGNFTTSNGGSVTYNFIARIDTTSNLLHQMGYGLNGTVEAIAVGLDGTIYAGGSFYASGLPGTNSLSSIAQYTGGNLWKSMGAGFNAPVDTGGVYALEIGRSGELLIGGGFTLSGTLPMNKFARWQGSSFNHVEGNFAGPSGGIRSIIVTDDDIIYVAVNSPATGYSASSPYVNTVVNEGSASVFPLMYIKGQGTLKYVENIKTGQAIYLNLQVFTDEEVEIDFSRGTIISETRGSLLFTILPGSEIRAVELLPGENSFAIYMDNEVSPTVQLRWQPHHWSVDAVTNPPAMA